MARIQDSVGRKDENSGYARVFGNQALGQLLSRTQATVIRNGNELERLLRSVTDPNLLASQGEVLGFLGSSPRSSLQVVFSLRKPSEEGKKSKVADIAIFDHRRQEIELIELKDGDTFDTKKVVGEYESLQEIREWLTQQTGYLCRVKFCSFNQNSKEAIVFGAKGRFRHDEVMLGSELCEKLRVDYEVFRTQRAVDQILNFEYFLEELVKIPEVREYLIQILGL